jgi:hypothetical protein
MVVVVVATAVVVRTMTVAGRVLFSIYCRFVS